MFERIPIYVLENEDSIGLDVIPLNSIVSTKTPYKMYYLVTTQGITNSSSFSSIKGSNFKEYIKPNDKHIYSSSLFYGGYNPNAINIITILSSTGSLKQPESNIGIARYSHAGANSGVNALFYGGYSTTYTSACTLLSSTATLIQPETNIGTARYGLAGANVGVNALFYCGRVDGATTNTTTLLSPSVALVQEETNAGTTVRYFLSGAKVNNTNALFYGGSTTDILFTLDTVTILTPTAVLAQSDITAGTARATMAGANVGVNALFSGGYTGSYLNTVTILSPIGILTQSEVNVGIVRADSAGTPVGSNAMIYAGTNINTCTILTPTATLFQSDVNVGTSRGGLAGASV